MTQSGISSCLTYAFSKCGYTSRVNCTKVRKAAVSEVHGNHPEKINNLAQHMCHLPSTAIKYYRHNDKKKNSIDMSNLLRNSLSKATVLQDQQAHDVMNSDPEIGNVLENEPQNLNDVNIDNPLGFQVKRNVWSKENRDMVEIVFKKFITMQKTPINQIKETLLANADVLHKLEIDMKLSGDNLARVVKDKVRTFFRSKYGYKHS
jgi:hypothetical protein